MVTPEDKTGEETNQEQPEKENVINDITNRQKRKEGFLKNLDGGVSVLKASKTAGIAYMTIWRWRKEDPEFDAAIGAIMESRIMIVEDALYLNAAKGNLGAQIFWLKNRSGGRWKDKTEQEVDLNHKGLDFDEFQTLKKMTEDERNAFISKLEEIIRSGDDKQDRESQGSDKERPVDIKESDIPEL